MYKMNKWQLKLQTKMWAIINNDAELSEAYNNYEFDKIYKRLVNTPTPMYNHKNAEGYYDFDLDGAEIYQTIFTMTLREKGIDPLKYVTRIWENMYYHMSIKSINIPNNVVAIDKWAFTFCTALKNVQIADSVQTIDTCAFSRCDILKSITLPINLQNVSANILSQNNELTSVKMFNKVKDIDIYAFTDTPKLNDIWYEGTKKEFNDITFHKTTIDSRDRQVWIDHVVTIHCKDGDIVYKPGKDMPNTIVAAY